MVEVLRILTFIMLTVLYVSFWLSLSHFILLVYEKGNQAINQKGRYISRKVSTSSGDLFTNVNNYHYSTLMVLESCFAFSFLGSVTYRIPFS